MKNPLIFDKTQPLAFLQDFKQAGLSVEDYTEELFVVGKLLPSHEKEIEILLKSSKKDILKAYKSLKKFRLTGSQTDYAYNLKSAIAYAKKSKHLDIGKVFLLLGHKHLYVAPDTPIGKELHLIPRFNGIKHLIIKDFKEIPLEITELTLLESIHIDSFYMEDWTLDITPLKNLKSFHLETHALRKLPEMLKNLPQLEVISLTGQQIVPTRLEIPEWLGSLKTLKKLVLTYQPATELPENVFSESLEEITLWYHKNLKALPASILRCSKLRSLAMNRCDNLTTLPEGMETLTNIEEIILQNMQSLQTLDERFVHGSQVKHLDLEGTNAQIINQK